MGQRTKDENPLRGRPLNLLPRAFKFTEEERMRALAGPPAWVFRRRRLDEAMGRLEAAIRGAWRVSSPDRWPAEAAAWDLGTVNGLIERFNRYYPVERDLPMDPRTRQYHEYGERWRPLPLLDAGWILERFPPDGAGASDEGA